jgi:hypothetical protein
MANTSKNPANDTYSFRQQPRAIRSKYRNEEEVKTNDGIK